MRRATPTFAALAASLTTGLASTSVAAQVVSTFGPGDSYDAGFGQAVTTGIVPDGAGGFISQAVAASFTFTAGAPRALANFRFAATANDGTDPLVARLLVGADLNAAVTLEAFSFGAAASGVPQIFTARSLLAPVLQPGQTYWIALGLAPSATAAWAWNVNDQGLTGVSVQNPVGSAWVAAPDSETPAFAVAVVPEPGTGVLALLGVLVGTFGGVRATVHRHGRDSRVTL